MFLKYYDNGYSPIPIFKTGKNPAIKTDWTKFCKERPTQEQIEKWESEKSNYNIGITCGPASGIIVVDIDIDDKSFMDLCPPSKVRRRGLKGEARVFKYDPKIQSVSIPGLDILADGRQFLVPPSIHPTTKQPYVWLTPDTLENTTPDELPDLDISFLNSLKSKTQKLIPVSAPGRNNKLVDIVSAMRGRGEPEGKIVNDVYEWDRNYHTSRLFTDSSEGFKAQSEDQARNNAWKFVNRVTQSLINNGAVILDAPNIVMHIDDADTESRKSEKHKVLEYPRPRGLMKLFTDVCELSSAGRQDAIGLGGAISLMGVLCSNRFNTEVRGLTTCPNIYVINLAYSSFGKETAQRLIHDVLFDTGLLGSSSYRSGSALVMNLPKQQERIDLIDECSAMLKAMGGKEDYKSEIVEILSTLYSKSNGKFLGFTSITNGERYGACYNPCVNFLGSTTPMGFRGSVNREMAGKGLLPRFLMFFQDELGEYKGRQDRSILADMKADLFHGIESIISIPKRQHVGFSPDKNLLASIKDKDGKDISAGIWYAPEVIPFSKDANEDWLMFDEECHNVKRHNPEGFESAFIGRFPELTAKLALFDAISLGRRTIESDSVAWARQLVEIQWHNVRPLYEIASAENQEESNLLRVLKIIQVAGCISRNELTHKTRWLAKNKREEIIRTLDESKSIEIVQSTKNGSSGRPSEFFRIPLTK